MRELAQRGRETRCGSSWSGQAVGLAHVLRFPQPVGGESMYYVYELVFIFHSPVTLKISEHKGRP